MSYEIEPYQGGKPDKQARKEVERLRTAESLNRTFIDAAEGAAAYEASVRLANGAQLVGQAQQNLTSLSKSSGRVTQDNPSLQMQHSELAEVYAMSAGQLIHGYMNRKKQFSS